MATLTDSLMDAHGLTLFDVLLLDLLAKSDSGSVRMRDVSDAFVMAPSRVTQQIRRLQTQGLVSRSPDPGDRRGVLASITNQGRSRLGPAIDTYAQGIRTHYVNQMSRQQMIALGDSCQRVSVATPPG
jgi:DNA-binding MarR family transcriptional regulator